MNGTNLALEAAQHGDAKKDGHRLWIIFLTVVCVNVAVILICINHKRNKLNKLKRRHPRKVRSNYGTNTKMEGFYMQRRKNRRFRRICRCVSFISIISSSREEGRNRPAVGRFPEPSPTGNFCWEQQSFQLPQVPVSCLSIHHGQRPTFLDLYNGPINSPSELPSGVSRLSIHNTSLSGSSHPVSVGSVNDLMSFSTNVHPALVHSSLESDYIPSKQCKPPETEARDISKMPSNIGRPRPSKESIYDRTSIFNSSSSSTLSRTSTRSAGRMFGYPHGGSQSSNSSYMSMQIKVPLTQMSETWHRKDTGVCPHNDLATYFNSATTQTDDLMKSNLSRKPLFCSTWQACKSFSPAGGTMTLPDSDLKLIVPPNAVPTGKIANVSAGTFTNLTNLRKALCMGEDALITSPLAELDAGPGFDFLENVQVHLPHCLSPRLSHEHIKVYHVNKLLHDELQITLLPSKNELESRKGRALKGKGFVDMLSWNDTVKNQAFYDILSNGNLVIYTKSFCGFICTECRERKREPQVSAVVTAEQILTVKSHGTVRQVRFRLFLWDKKNTIQDFRRDYLKPGTIVGEQTLRVIEDYMESVVKIVFNFYDIVSVCENQWMHAVRPGTEDPIFPPTKEFPLKDLLCCQANADSPICEEWLVESSTDRRQQLVDLQCFLDIMNVGRTVTTDEDDQDLHAPIRKTILFVDDVNFNASRAAEKAISQDFSNFRIADPRNTTDASPIRSQSRITNHGWMEEGSDQRPPSTHADVPVCLSPSSRTTQLDFIPPRHYSNINGSYDIDHDNLPGNRQNRERPLRKETTL